MVDDQPLEQSNDQVTIPKSLLFKVEKIDRKKRDEYECAKCVVLKEL